MAPPFDDLWEALRAAAYHAVLARRSTPAPRRTEATGVSPGASRALTGAVLLGRAERGRATYEAAAHLIDPDTARVIDL